MSKKMGRPKGDNNKDFAYTIRMDEKTFERLAAYCIKMGKLKSEVIREAINSITEKESDSFL